MIVRPKQCNVVEPSLERLLSHSSSPYRKDLLLRKVEDKVGVVVDQIPGVLQDPGMADSEKIKSQLLKPLMSDIPGHELQRCL